MTESIYERIEVFFAGQKLTARPIKFTMDEQKNPIEAIGWETTCPGCGCAVPFTVDDVAILDDKTYVCCPECKAGENDKIRIKADELSIACVGQNIGNPKQPRKPVDRGCPFVDPIELGLFRTDVPAQPKLDGIGAEIKSVIATGVGGVYGITGCIPPSTSEILAALEIAPPVNRVPKAGAEKKPAQPNMVLGMGAAPPDEQ